MATLGHTTDEAAVSNLGSDELEVFGPYTATENGTITSITARLDGQLAGGTDQQYRLEVYVDSSGSPGAKVAETALTTMVAGTAVSDVTISATGSITNVSLYWIGIYTATTGTPCLRQYLVSSGPAGYAYLLPAGGFAPDPFGTPAGSGSNVTPTYYLTYTPSASPPVVGLSYNRLPALKGP